MANCIATGVWAEGGRVQDYQIYRTVFIYDGTYTVPGGPSSGFVTGHKILGIGIKSNSGADGYAVVTLDPNNNSYKPDSTGSTGDGKGPTSFNTVGDLGDSVMHFPGDNPTEITIRNSGAWVANGPPCVTAGGSCYYLPYGGDWSTHPPNGQPLASTASIRQPA